MGWRTPEAYVSKVRTCVGESPTLLPHSIVWKSHPPFCLTPCLCLTSFPPFSPKFLAGMVAGLVFLYFAIYKLLFRWVHPHYFTHFPWPTRYKMSVSYRQRSDRSSHHSHKFHTPKLFFHTMYRYDMSIEMTPRQRPSMSGPMADVRARAGDRDLLRGPR